MNIKYRHRNCDRAFTPATFAYELPPAAVLEKMIHQGEPIINFPFGVTYLHEKDFYSKAVGRKYALADLQRTQSTQFKCQWVGLEDGWVRFGLVTINNNNLINLTISVDFQTEKMRLDRVEIS